MAPIELGQAYDNKLGWVVWCQQVSSDLLHFFCICTNTNKITNITKNTITITNTNTIMNRYKKYHSCS